MKTLTKEKALDWLLILLISGTIMVICNIIGYDGQLGTSILGMLVLIGIAFLGTCWSEIMPGNAPAILYISIIGIVLALPFMPTSTFIVNLTQNISMLALTTPTLAFAGVSIGKSWAEFKKIGWRGIVVTLLVLFGTFFTSALLAEILLRIGGQL